MSGDATLYAVIMAGGSGTRFWPVSRGGHPKQFLRLLGDESMLEQTVRRIERLIPIDRVLLVTGEAHAAQVRQQLPELPARNLLLEPMARNTAPCIGLAAVALAERDPDAVMAVLPADHFVGDDEAFCSVLAAAGRLAASGRLVTVGVRPNRPETGYGYLRQGDYLGEESARMVDAFVEKPDFDRAVEYLASGRYLWNSGMFFFRPRRILQEFQRHLPRHWAALGRIRGAWGGDDHAAVLTEEFAAMESISIDYGIMEKADEIAVLAGRFPWNDVGSWGALHDVLPRSDEDSVHLGTVVELDGRGNILVAEQGVVATVGLRQTVVVRSGDRVLVCPRTRAQEVRGIVDALRAQGLDDYL